MRRKEALHSSARAADANVFLRRTALSSLNYTLYYSCAHLIDAGSGGAADAKEHMQYSTRRRRERYVVAPHRHLH